MKTSAFEKHPIRTAILVECVRLLNRTYLSILMGLEPQGLNKNVPHWATSLRGAGGPVAGSIYG